MTAATACAASTWVVDAAEVKPTDNDAETDVLVVGFGGAGACAAIEAHDHKARVLLVEKSAEGGGNTCVSAGCFMLADNKEHAYEYLAKTYDFTDSTMNPELVKIFVDENSQIKGFLESLGEGVELFYLWPASYPELPYANEIKQYSTRYNGKTGGSVLYDLYKQAVTKRGIPVWYNSPAKRLIVSEGKVVGAQIEKEGELVNVKACKGVILTCGGYENNPYMLQNFVQGKDIIFVGTPFNSGDGINMSIAVGAKLWHLTAVSSSLGSKIPGKQAGEGMVCPAAGIWVDQFGKRFIDEKNLDFHIGLYAVNVFDSIDLCFHRIPSYMIFDNKARTRQVITSPVKGWVGEKEGFTWSKGCKAEIADGLVKQADTIGQLAEKIGLDPKALEATVETWNKDVAAGKDTVEGRSMKDAKGFVVSEPLNQPPYSAVALYPILVNTQGGPVRDSNCQVIDTFGEPIPGLYTAGELGSMWGNVYQGACNLAESLVFGRRAGRIVVSL